MILSNVGIQAALDAGDLSITPEPNPRRLTGYDRSCPYDTCSVNLRLSSEIQIPKPDLLPITLDFRRGSVSKFLPQLFDRFVLDTVVTRCTQTSSFWLKPMSE
jgi:hypothetical protein